MYDDRSACTRSQRKLPFNVCSCITACEGKIRSKKAAHIMPFVLEFANTKLQSQLASIPTRLLREHNLHWSRKQILRLHRLAHFPEVIRLSMRLDRSSIFVAAIAR